MFDQWHLGNWIVVSAVNSCLRIIQKYVHCDVKPDEPIAIAGNNMSYPNFHLEVGFRLVRFKAKHVKKLKNQDISHYITFLWWPHIQACFRCQRIRERHVLENIIVTPAFLYSLFSNGRIFTCHKEWPVIGLHPVKDDRVLLEEFIYAIKRGYRDDSLSDEQMNLILLVAFSEELLYRHEYQMLCKQIQT